MTRVSQPSTPTVDIADGDIQWPAGGRPAKSSLGSCDASLADTLQHWRDQVDLGSAGEKLKQLPKNISRGERIGSALGGAAMVLGGLKRGHASGLLMTLAGGALLARGVSGHCAGYQAMGMDTSDYHRQTAVPNKTGAKVERTIVIGKSPEEIYSFWRDVENLPRAMHHLKSVEAIDRQRSRWVADGVFGKLVQWEAEIFQEHEPDTIAWRSIPGGDVDTAGSIHLRSLGHDRGTAVTISLRYNPPAGALGVTVASLMGEGVEDKLDEDLRRLKSLLETGEVPTITGQPSGRCTT